MNKEKCDIATPENNRNNIEFLTKYKKIISYPLYKCPAVILPGAQIKNNYIMDYNSRYFAYSSTLSLLIFSKFSFEKIATFSQEKSLFYLKICAISKSKIDPDLAAISYEKNKSVIVYRIGKGNVNIFSFEIEIKYFEFNTENNLIILFENNTVLYIENPEKAYDKKDSNNQAFRYIKVCSKPNNIRWYPFNRGNNKYLAYSTVDNDIYSVNLLSKRKYEVEMELNSMDKSFKGQTIVQIEFYMSDENYNYLLVGFKSTEMVLLDLSPDNKCIITKFEKHGQNLNRIIWIENEPGLFITTLDDSSKITYFNVSKSKPKLITKFCKQSIHKMLILNDINNSNNKAVLALKSGEVLVYNMEKRNTERKISYGHAYPVFNLKVSPFLNQTFATCDTNNSLNIWSLSEKTQPYDTLIKPKILKPNINCNISGINTNSITNNNDNISTKVNTQIFSLVWSPKGEENNMILTGDSDGILRLWDIEKEKNLSSINISNYINNNDEDEDEDNIKNKKCSIMGIDWNLNSEIILSCRNYILILNLLNMESPNFKVIKIIHEKAKIFNIAFMSIYLPIFDKNNLIAAACDDQKIKLYKISSEKDNVNDIKVSLYKQLAGHTESVFEVKFIPREKNINQSPLNNARYLIKYYNLNEDNCYLVSSSDDNRLGIWNICEKKPSPKFLVGHTNKVRHISYIKKSPNIILSCSWDCTIRVWDIKYCICLFVLYGHTDDVYGIDTCFYYAFSGSRDASIRVWVLDYLKEYNNDISDDDIYNDDNNNARENLYKVNNDNSSKDNMEALISNSLKKMQNNYIPNHDFEYTHFSNVYAYIKSTALKYEFEFYESSDKNLNYEKAYFCIKNFSLLGMWEKVCELYIKLGEWKTALMIAPKVSKNYWKKLIQKYNESIAKDENNEYVKYIDYYNNANNNDKNNIENDSNLNDNLMLRLGKIVNNSSQEWLANNKSNNANNNINNNPSLSFFSSSKQHNFLKKSNEILHGKSKENLEKISRKIGEKFGKNQKILDVAGIFLSVEMIYEGINAIIRGGHLGVAEELIKLHSKNMNLISTNYSLLISELFNKEMEGTEGVKFKKLMEIIKNKCKNDLEKLIFYRKIEKNMGELNEKDMKDYRNILEKIGKFKKYDNDCYIEFFFKIYANLIKNVENYTVTKENLIDLIIGLNFLPSIELLPDSTIQKY